VDEAMREWTQELLLRLDLDADDTEITSRALADLVRSGGGSETARAVPLMVELRREGRTWLLRSRSHTLALGLGTLRSLRALPGFQGLQIRCGLPAAPPRRRNGFRREASG
jgi:hypothetical protein